MSEQVLSVKAVEMKGLSFGYRGSSVLYKVDFQLNAGDYAIFTGENGSGKSTFLKLLLGELLPEEGSVEVFGMPPSEKLFRRFRIGYVAQNSISGNQHFPATVREVMMTGLQYSRTKRMKKGQAQERISQFLQKLEMEPYLERQISALSGGQQQRVMLARALAGVPELLVLDEPATGMDAHSLRLFASVLQEENQKRKLTILLVTHGNIEKFAGANRRFVIEDGSVKEG